MKISTHWCADFLASPPPPPAELAEILTARGLEVDEIITPAATNGIVVGEIISCEPHPNADKLSVCRVSAPEISPPLTIVCGAANAAVGVFCALAKPGAVVGGRKIEQREVRGVLSQGMLCSAAELGLGEVSAGILELSADDDALLAALTNDSVLDVGITPNRGDCLSHLGIAREISAATGIALSPPPAQITPEIDEGFSVQINAPAACPYYSCLLIRDVDCSRPSPWWLRARIESVGARSISAVVDVTNYIMRSVGQPLHAFDADKLSGGIIVRHATAGEKLRVLDGSLVECGAEDLLIADEAGGVALGGVMGGLESSVTDSTRNILLEAAFFAPSAVRGRARRFGLTSDAAFHFERGVDASLPEKTLMAAARLIQQYCGGKCGKIASAGQPPQPSRVSVPAKKVQQVLGVDISADESVQLLNRLHLPAMVEKNGEEAQLSVDVPSWRFDLQTGIDLVEEIARAWGYEKLPETMPRGGRVFLPGAQTAAAQTPVLPEASARAFFAARGFFEIITYSFVPEQWERGLSNTPPLHLQNPMSEETSTMRTTLWGGLLDRAKFNNRRHQERVCLFEIGRCFSAPAAGEPLPKQPTMLSGIACGRALPSGWAADTRTLDFYDAKGLVESFIAQHGGVAHSGAATEFSPASAPPPALHPGKSAVIFCAGEEIGQLGELHPAHPDAAEFKSPPLLFELNLDKISTLTAAHSQVTPVSRFPRIWRDLAVTAASALPAGDLLACAKKSAANSPVVDVQLFDYYTASGDNTPNDKKGFGLRLWMQGDNANLLGEEIDRIVGGVLDSLRQECGAILREAPGLSDGETK